MILQPQHLHRRSNRSRFAGLAFLFSIFFAVAAFAHDPFDVDLNVWSSQSFDDPFCSDDPIDIYFRVDRPSYITVYQINPYGGVDILYPLSRHRWVPVFPGRTYRLIDLSADLDFFYGGIEGRAYIGVIATRQPIDIVPWLEAGFRDCGLVFGRPSHVTVGVDFQFVINRVLADVRVRLGNACAPSYYVAPIYVRPSRHVWNHHRPPAIVWPEPPRHKSHPPKWGWGYDNHPTPPQPEPEKRPFRRRDFKSSESPEVPYTSRPAEPQWSKPVRASESETRADHDRQVIKKSGDSRTRNDSGSTNSGKSSGGQERRVKKPRN